MRQMIKKCGEEIFFMLMFKFTKILLPRVSFFIGLIL